MYEMLIMFNQLTILYGVIFSQGLNVYKYSPLCLHFLSKQCILFHKSLWWLDTWLALGKGIFKNQLVVLITKGFKA